MKRSILLCRAILACGVSGNIGYSAPPDHALLESPSQEYSIQVSEKGEISANGHLLNIFHHGIIVAHYPFEGELVSAYWSPSGRYVAINNHSGVNGWWLWIVRLKDGRLVRAGYTVASSNYERYSDYQCFPDLFDSTDAKAKIRAVYGEYHSDQMRLGYTTIGYGWQKGDFLLIHHRLAFDRLASDDGSIIEVLEQFKVGTNKVVSREGSVSARRVKLSEETKEMPADVAPLFD